MAFLQVRDEFKRYLTQQLCSFAGCTIELVTNNYTSHFSLSKHYADKNYTTNVSRRNRQRGRTATGITSVSETQGSDDKKR